MTPDPLLLVAVLIAVTVWSGALSLLLNKITKARLVFPYVAVIFGMLAVGVVLACSVSAWTWTAGFFAIFFGSFAVLALLLTAFVVTFDAGYSSRRR
jgi:hypothetical protein